MTRVVVVGGGIAGLAAALELVRDPRDLEVTLIESTPTVGGKLRISEVGGVALDEGAEAFLRRVPEALDLVTSLGRSGELVSPAVSNASVWARGELRPMPARTLMGLPADPATLLGVLSEAEVERARRDRELPGEPPGDDISVGQWVGDRLGRAVVERLVDPLLGGVYAGRADELSLAATVPQLPRDEVSVLAAVERALPVPPAPGQAAVPVFATVTGGMGSLPGSIADAVRAGGGTILTRRAVRRLEQVVGGWRVVHGATNDEQAIVADAVIVALPAAPSARLLAPVAPLAAAELASIDAASMAIVRTAWRAADVPELASSGYLVPASYGRPVKAVTFAATKWPHLATPEVMVVRSSIGRFGDVTDLQRDDSELTRAAADELRDFAGFQGQPIDAALTRWGGALPQYAVGHRDRVARVRADVASVDGLAVCGATYDGVGVPACIRTAKLAVGQILAGLRIPESHAG